MRMIGWRTTSGQWAPRPGSRAPDIHGNHEGLIVDESAGHTAGGRANRASMSGALGLGQIVQHRRAIPANFLR
jgi:hypothetical protein